MESLSFHRVIIEIEEIAIDFCVTGAILTIIYSEKQLICIKILLSLLHLRTKVFLYLIELPICTLYFSKMQYEIYWSDDLYSTTPNYHNLAFTPIEQSLYIITRKHILQIYMRR